MFGFIANAAGNLRPVLSSHLAFNIGNRRAGDCHVKWGHLEQAEMFAVKVATGFCDKPGSGLPSGNGLMPLLPARTGAPFVQPTQGLEHAGRTHHPRAGTP